MATYARVDVDMINTTDQGSASHGAHAHHNGRMIEDMGTLDAWSLRTVIRDPGSRNVYVYVSTDGDVAEVCTQENGRDWYAILINANGDQCGESSYWYNGRSQTLINLGWLSHDRYDCECANRQS